MTEPTTAHRPLTAAAAVFAGGSEMAARCRAFDWAATPIGPVDAWPGSLRSVAAVVVAARQPMFLWWGPELVQLYNDAYRPSLGADRHPAALGASGRAFWADAWPAIGPDVEGVLAGGPAVWYEDRLVPIVRDGRREDVYWTYGYTPVPDDAGRAAGVLVTVVETTARVRGRAAEEARALAALTASEARFRTVQDASPLGFCIHRPVRDADGTVVDFVTPYINAAGAGILGQPRERVMAERLLAIWPAAGAEGIVADYARVLATGESNVRELLYEHDELAAGLTLTAVRIGAGADAEVGVTFTDVTGRLRADRERARLLAALGAERERLRTLILHMPAPLALAEGREHRFTLVNDAFKRVSGGGRDVTGLTPREAFPELAGSGIYELFDRVYATGEPWLGPETPVRYDRHGTGVEDTWFDLRYDPVRDADGRVTGVLNFAVEVTDQVRARREVERLLAESDAARAELAAANAQLLQQQAELELANRRLQDNAAELEAQAEALHATAAALGESESRYRALFDALDAGFCVVEMVGDAGGPGGWARDYRFLEGNPAFLAQTGLVDPVGRTARDLVPGLEDHWVQVYGRVADTGEPTRFEQGSDAMGRWFSVYAFRVGAPERRRVAIFFHDVSAEKAAARERERLLGESERTRAEADAARRDAEAANRAKGEFLAVMSHELRTPLNAIGGYAELIELGIYGPVTEAQRTALARIQVSQRHLLGLIAGVLDYSRVEAGAVTYRLAAVPVVEAVTEAEVLVAPQLRAKGLGYAWSGAAPGLAVRADREKLQQILLNLLGNAVKFTDPRDGAPGRIEVACTVDGAAVPARVAIHVRDTGGGIAPEQLERVFEPFVQADQRLTRPHAGVGLGLAISRDLARGMGGDLTAESTPGVGSTFTLALPAAP